MIKIIKERDKLYYTYLHAYMYSKGFHDFIKDHLYNCIQTSIDRINQNYFPNKAYFEIPNLRNTSAKDIESIVVSKFHKGCKVETYANEILEYTSMLMNDNRESYRNSFKEDNKSLLDLYILNDGVEEAEYDLDDEVRRVKEYNDVIILNYNYNELKYLNDLSYNNDNENGDRLIKFNPTYKLLELLFNSYFNNQITFSDNYKIGSKLNGVQAIIDELARIIDGKLHISYNISKALFLAYNSFDDKTYYSGKCIPEYIMFFGMLQLILGSTAFNSINDVKKTLLLIERVPEDCINSFGRIKTMIEELE